METDEVIVLEDLTYVVCGRNGDIDPPVLYLLDTPFPHYKLM